MIRRASRGFTLIELLVVVIIMAVMAGVAVPAYSRLAAKTRFDSIVSDVQDLFGYAREQAVSKDTIVTVTYNAQGEAFTVTPAGNIPPTDLPTVESNSANAQAGNSQQAHPTNQGAPARVVQLPPGYSVGFTAEADSSDPVPSDAPQLGTGANTVRFHGDGTSDGADVTLTCRDGDAVLKLSPATGRLTLVDPNRRRMN